MSKKFNNAKFRILGNIFTVKRMRGMVNSGIMGKCFFDQKLIYIDESLSDYDCLHTLIHELGHALSYSSSVYQALEPNIEEILVDVYATFLLENFSLKKIEKRKPPSSSAE